MKKIILPSCILLFTSFYTKIFSQSENYEFAIVRYAVHTAFPKKYTVSVNYANTFNTEEGKVEESNAYTNTMAVVTKLEALSKENWEVYNSSVYSDAVYFNIFYQLRRKNKE